MKNKEINFLIVILKTNYFFIIYLEILFKNSLEEFINLFIFSCKPCEKLLLSILIEKKKFTSEKNSLFPLI